ncbi:1434_t:CDS:10 [Acaulospora morrowiae]|uniref:P-type H(+)-exporting transporter n=1 Tax=Acaulospora morrowiae TaxID=94023 RepID=A0A9N9ATV1_9GLOM|nr:1434_t:CDS:10 [Acaulospora morrowiae]
MTQKERDYEKVTTSKIDVRENSMPMENNAGKCKNKNSASQDEVIVMSKINNVEKDVGSNNEQNSRVVRKIYFILSLFLSMYEKRNGEPTKIADEITPSLEELLSTEPRTGLTTEEAKLRLRRFGRNEINDVKPYPLLKFLSYFRGPIAYLIEIACIVAAIVGDWVDLGIILGLLIVNACIGFIEEARAESALDALRQTLALTTRVWRDGKLVEVDSAELVPGDVIALRIGDIVPADSRLLGISVTGNVTESLLVDQSALTGESLPVRCNKDDYVYSSSIIKQGQMLAIVCKTGEDTYIGRAATLMNMTVDQGHFQKILRGSNILETLQLALLLTVAAIPVGLPTVLSVTMAVGAKQLSAKKVIIKRLTAVEELASVSLLCTDKTGTLTLNELTFDKPWLYNGHTSSELLLYSYLCSEPSTNDAIETAIRNAAESELDFLKDNENDHEIPGYKVTSFTPFNPSTKLSRAVVKNLQTGEIFQVVKGAPQVIIKLVNGNDEITNAVNDLASRGLRALGVARSSPLVSKEISNDINNHDLRWDLIGMISLLDPPRPDSKETLNRCKELGVNIKMITGDQVVIAKEVAHRLEMGRVILDANYLVDPSRSEEVMTEACERADGFAQVTPEHKYRVVELLQKKGYLVGMTGDGVNDAPALKRANVGIAVQGCTNAARSAADIVLLASGLSTIVDGITTSRAIFQRMRSYSLYRITSTIHFLLFFFFIILIKDWRMPAVLLILIALLNDAATLVISVDNAQISERPDKWRIGQLITLSIILGILLTGFSFAHFFIFEEIINVDPNRLQTVMYLHISSAPHFVIFSTRLTGHFWENIPSPIFIASIFGTQIFAMFLSAHGWLTEAIGWPTSIVILSISLVIFIILDFVKVFVFRYWSFELTTKLWPSPARRAVATVRREKSETKKRVSVNFEKVRKVLLMVKVIRLMKMLVNSRKVKLERRVTNNGNYED